MPLDVTTISTLPLPDGWSAPERVEDTVVADGLELHRVGLSSRCGEDEALGAAAAWDESPAMRSGLELLERIALMQASRRRDARYGERTLDGTPAGLRDAEAVFPVSPEPSTWAYARSNGVALHRSWSAACERAMQELVERDRIQRSWLGEIVPRRIEMDLARTPLAHTRSYDWRAYELPAADDEPHPTLRVAGLFGFPGEATAPLVFGYGARPDLPEAIESAMREAAQQLAFLWGEPIPERLPDPAPTPFVHLETFQVRAMHAVLRGWLDGGHVRHARGRDGARPTRAAFRFVDITPAWLRERGLHVARATSESVIPLCFGPSPTFAHLPPELRLHPVP